MPAIVASLIILLGLALRAYHLGQNQFWGDEGAQAWAAIQPTIGAILAVERVHVMAMPLDYLVSAMMTHVGLSEGILRIPSMIWGTLTIPMWFLIAKELLPGRKGYVVGLSTMFLLSLSKVHIQYSQEMRFYAALGFFYAFSTWRLLRAHRNPSARNWGYFIAISAVGIYFHPYVYLVLVYGALLGLADLISYKTHPEQTAPGANRAWQFIIGLCSSALVLLLIFLPAYSYFSHPIHAAQGAPLTLPRVLEGLGLWNIDSAPLQYTAFYYVMIVATLLGFLLAFRERRWPMLLFALGAFIQITAIYGADWLSHYLMAPRQTIHLAPVLMLFASVSIAALLDQTRRFGALTQGLAAFLLAGVIGMLALPNINAYYLTPKTNVRSEAERILRAYHPGDKILISTDFGPASRQAFFFYFSQGPDGESAILNSSRYIALRDLGALTREEPGQVFLILGAKPIDAGTEDGLATLGFRCLTPGCFEVPSIRYMHGTPRVLIRDQP